MTAKEYEKFVVDGINAQQQGLQDNLRWLETKGANLADPTAAAFGHGYENGWHDALAWAKLHGYIRVE